MAKRKQNKLVPSSTAEYLTYVASVGGVRESLEVRCEKENIWLTQKMMAALYGVDVRTINYHVLKIFRGSKLERGAVI